MEIIQVVMSLIDLVKLFVQRANNLYNRLWYQWIRNISDPIRREQLWRFFHLSLTHKQIMKPLPHYLRKVEKLKRIK